MDNEVGGMLNEMTFNRLEGLKKISKYVSQHNQCKDQRFELRTSRM
jgi:hypothetical protein